MTNPSILVLESDPIEQYVLKSLLEQFDCEAHVVTSTEDALKTFSEHQYGAVLVNIGSDGQDRTAYISELRKLETGRRKPTPIIALISDSERQDRKVATEAGTDDCLNKPIQQETLRRILLRYLYIPEKPNLKLLGSYKEKLD